MRHGLVRSCTKRQKNLEFKINHQAGLRRNKPFGKEKSAEFFRHLKNVPSRNNFRNDKPLFRLYYKCQTTKNSKGNIITLKTLEQRCLLFQAIM